MSIKQLLHQATSLVYDAGEETPAPVKPGTTPAPHVAFNLPPASFSTGGGAAAAPAMGSPFSVPGTTVLDEKVYATVLAKTNFNTTTVGKAILKYYDALEGVIADQNGRFKAAIQQAQKLDGITPDQVLATFDQLSAALSTDAVANLIANLQKTGYFKTVEIDETYQDDQIKDMQAFQFTLNCQKGKS